MNFSGKYLITLNYKRVVDHQILSSKFRGKCLLKKIVHCWSSESKHQYINYNTSVVPLKNYI